MVRYCLFLAALTASLFAQSWQVKSEWVRAHEEFLASDALQGRGSATRDEAIAAAYVGTHFLTYGLQTAPGLSTFVQTVEFREPELDGHATITAGELTLNEGSDFYLLASTGESVSAPLQAVTEAQITSGNIPPKAALLLKDTDGPTRSDPRLKLPVLILLAESERTKDWRKRNQGKPFLQRRLQGGTGVGLGPETTRVAVTGQAFAKLIQLPPGTPATLTVHQVPVSPQYTANAIGFLPGLDQTAGTILITAHLDHLGVRDPIDGDRIYNGADDDAAGTTAVLEIAHAFAAMPRTKRSLLFVCFGSEELGLIGSSYFRSNPPIPLKSIVANLELEMIGAQDPKMPKGFLLFTGWERSNLGPVLRDHGAKLGPDPYPEQHFFQRSDNYALALKGVVAQTAAGWAMPPYYHQPDDDLQHLDLPFMTDAIQSMIEPLHWLANSDFFPRWNPGQDPAAN